MACVTKATSVERRRVVILCDGLHDRRVDAILHSLACSFCLLSVWFSLVSAYLFAYWDFRLWRRRRWRWNCAYNLRICQAIADGLKSNSRIRPQHGYACYCHNRDASSHKAVLDHRRAAFLIKPSGIKSSLRHMPPLISCGSR